jgi:hypothetical protein
MSYQIVIRNRKIFEFYDTHKYIKIEDMNILLVDILNKLLVETSSTPDSNFVCNISNNLSFLKNLVENLETKNSDNLSLKLSEFRKESFQDLKLLLSENSSEKIKPLLKEYNDILQDKTKIIINDIFPQNIEKISKEINEIKSANTKEFLEQESINKNLQELLKKFENSSSKGIYSEKLLINILNNEFNSAEIKHVGTTKENCDILLSRKNKPTILIENKEYESKNIPSTEVDKFIRDIKIQNCSGIMLSQHSSIVFRNNFEIAFFENKIAVFVENVNYDVNKIKIAINLIDQLSEIIDQTTLNPDFINIDKETLTNINKEVNNFIVHRENLISSLKDFTSKHVKQLEEMNLDTLTNILETHFGSNKPTNICDICNLYSAKNARAMAKHKQTCIKKKLIN